MSQQVNNANKKIESDVGTNSIALMNAKSTVQPVVDSQTMNSGAREIVPKEILCFNTFDALTNTIGATSTPRWADIPDEEEEQVNSPPMQKKLSRTALAFVSSGAKLVTPRQGLSSSTNVVAILSNHLLGMLIFLLGNNKTKHGRKHSWDDKVNEEFVPRHLPIRLAKQNHMIVSTTLTRFNIAKR
ncbi:hypothetical protein KY290_028395 [Solanum tuberosum]|uniref:Uncharacterized protein n=1 Tax=Solanum tuberosum TaxID=4113 RepID=A0ABQ7UHT1_SOLTU|nr:hypothetical protein KY290_028395 [Solanum tuberosum]